MAIEYFKNEGWETVKDVGDKKSYDLRFVNKNSKRSPGQSLALAPVVAWVHGVEPALVLRMGRRSTVSRPTGEGRRLSLT